jgi:hypothetical protein
MPDCALESVGASDGLGAGAKFLESIPGHFPTGSNVEVKENAVGTLAASNALKAVLEALISLPKKCFNSRKSSLDSFAAGGHGSMPSHSQQEM